MSAVNPYRNPLFTKADLRPVEEGVLALHLGGQSVHQIAALTGHSEAQVKLYLKNAIAARERQRLDDEHTRQIAALERMLSGLQDGLLKITELIADPATNLRGLGPLLRQQREYLDSVRAVEADRRELLGLNAPRAFEHHHTTDDNTTDRELLDLLSEQTGNAPDIERLP
jgi:hypothetical protein